MICPSSLSLLSSRGSISLTLADPDFGRPGELTYCSELTSSLYHCCKAGGQDLLALLQPSKQSLVGFWRVWWNQKVTHIKLLRIMHLLSLETTSSAYFGKLKVQEATSNCSRNERGRFIVPVPQKPNPTIIGRISITSGQKVSLSRAFITLKK